MDKRRAGFPYKPIQVAYLYPYISFIHIHNLVFLLTYPCIFLLFSAWPQCNRLHFTTTRSVYHSQWSLNSEKSTMVQWMVCLMIAKKGTITKAVSRQHILWIHTSQADHLAIAVCTARTLWPLERSQCHPRLGSTTSELFDLLAKAVPRLSPHASSTLFLTWFQKPIKSSRLSLLVQRATSRLASSVSPVSHSISKRKIGPFCSGITFCFFRRAARDQVFARGAPLKTPDSSFWYLICKSWRISVSCSWTYDTGLGSSATNCDFGAYSSKWPALF